MAYTDISWDEAIGGAPAAPPASSFPVETPDERRAAAARAVAVKEGERPLIASEAERVAHEASIAADKRIASGEQPISRLQTGKTYPAILRKSDRGNFYELTDKAWAWVYWAGN